EDGIGMARTFEAEFTGTATDATGVRRGFFAAVDATPLPANPTSYITQGARPLAVETPVTITARPAFTRGAWHVALPTGVLTGVVGAQVLEPLLAPFEHVRVIPVANEFFGGNTG